MSTKRNYSPHKTKRARSFGFRKRAKTKKGLLIFKRKRLKGRKRLAV